LISQSPTNLIRAHPVNTRADKDLTVAEDMIIISRREDIKAHMIGIGGIMIEGMTVMIEVMNEEAESTITDVMNN
jgi:hypothetical protein